MSVTDFVKILKEMLKLVTVMLQKAVLFIFIVTPMTMKIMVTLGYSHEQQAAVKQKTYLVLKAVVYQSTLLAAGERR
jgi:hypothetical protein